MKPDFYGDHDKTARSLVGPLPQFKESTRVPVQRLISVPATNNDSLFVNKYKPQSLIELVVQKKKICEVKEWLLSSTAGVVPQVFIPSKPQISMQYLFWQRCSFYSVTIPFLPLLYRIDICCTVFFYLLIGILFCSNLSSFYLV